MSGDYCITEMPLTLPLAKRRVEQFLRANGLRLDGVDTYCAITRGEDGEMVAGAGLQGNVIKCVAVSEADRGEGLLTPLVSRLLGLAAERGHDTVRVFTKPDNDRLFASLGFRLLATAPKAILMENGINGLEAYCRHLRGVRGDRPGEAAAIVMNANPFTRGHLHLVEQAAKQAHTVYVIVVREERGGFSYRQRREMIAGGCAHLPNVVVVEGSEYAVSELTFPSYFLKQVSDVTDTHITLDLDLFATHIAPALGVATRYVGTEPGDPLTARYNALMAAQLPPRGIAVRVVERLRDAQGQHISASRLRQALAGGDTLSDIAALAPGHTLAFVLADMACQALTAELELTPKPGLVDCRDCGAHSDMDLPLMRRSIDALRPHFRTLALYGNRQASRTLPLVPDDFIPIGQQAESDMLAATGGVNTHRGALFALGITIMATAWLLERNGCASAQALQESIRAVAGQMPGTHGTHGNEVVRKHGVQGALALAQSGYMPLFADWLPLYRSLAGDPWQQHKTLLRIIATLDDTNVIHRAGPQRALALKAEAAHLLEQFSPGGLEELNDRCMAERISPGGAADMLALTLLTHRLLPGEAQHDTTTQT